MRLAGRAAVAAVMAGAVTLAFGGRLAGAGSSRHAHVHRAVERGIAGLGPVITSAHGGAIDGWGIDENGSDGVLSEVFSRGRFSLITTVETFDQSTGAITKVVAKQQSVNGNKKFVVASMLAGDLGLIDDRRHQRDGRRDTFYVLSGVDGGDFTGRWTPPVPTTSGSPPSPTSRRARSDFALQDGKITFNRVRVHVATNILANAVIDRLMTGKHAADPRAAAVAHNISCGVKLLIQNRPKVLNADRGNVVTANATAAFD